MTITYSTCPPILVDWVNTAGTAADRNQRASSMRRGIGRHPAPLPIGVDRQEAGMRGEGGREREAFT